MFTVVKLKDLTPEVDGTMAYSQFDAALRGVQEDPEGNGVDRSNDLNDQRCRRSRHSRSQDYDAIGENTKAALDRSAYQC